MKKMGDLGGMGDMADMAKMAAGMGLGGKSKFNMGAMQSHLNQNMKLAKTKERMQQKLDQHKAAALKAAQAQAQTQSLKPVLFSTGEKVERTPRFPTGANGPGPGPGPGPSPGPNANDVNKKKKNKNKK